MRLVNETQFDALVVETDGLIVVDFFADWCAPCRALSPILERVADQYPAVAFVKIDTEASPRIGRSFGVRALPTVLVLRSMAEQRTADVISVSVGVKPESYWTQVLDRALAPAPGLFSFITRWFTRQPQ